MKTAFKVGESVSFYTGGNSHRKTRTGTVLKSNPRSFLVRLAGGRIIKRKIPRDLPQHEIQRVREAQFA